MTATLPPSGSSSRGLTAELGGELKAEARMTEFPLCPRCRKHEPVTESGALPTL